MCFSSDPMLKRLGWRSQHRAEIDIRLDLDQMIQDGMRWYLVPDEVLVTRDRVHPRYIGTVVHNSTQSIFLYVRQDAKKMEASLVQPADSSRANSDREPAGDQDAGAGKNAKLVGKQVVEQRASAASSAPLGSASSAAPARCC